MALLFVLQGCADPVTQTNRHVKRARDAVKTGSYDKAIEEYNKALLISPNHPAALKGIVETCEKKGDYAGAIDAQKKYIEAVPNPDLTLNRRNLMGKSIPEGFQERQKGAGIAVVPFAG